MGNFQNLSGWDTFLLMFPFLVLFVLGMLRMDERLASPRPAPKRRFFCGVDEKDRPFLSDPDGRPWMKSRQIEATLLRTDDSR